MNAESLVGNVLGTCTLQRIIGQGGMGAVFLAQQSRPRRQVAVKVLLPSTSLTQTQKVAFLERFRRETDAAASLEHPNILPVYEYGEQNGLAYLVVPYISGGTLRDVMEHEATLPLDRALNYVEQLAAALDFAHAHGVIHRDIKPANVLITPEGRLLLSDFGLVKIVAEGQTPQMRLTGAGAPVGTPDYMAPEQVIGEAVDGRSDQYSLGVILYQMLTGLTPFQGETPMQIAAQQLQSPPPSPRIVRRDLPVAAEQVLLRTLAKRPADRYLRCQDFVQAFRVAITPAYPVAQMAQPGFSTTGLLAFNNDGAASAKLFTPRSLFDPQWTTGPTEATAAIPNNPANGELSRPTGVLPTISTTTSATANVPASPASPRPGGLLSRTGMFPTVGTGQIPAVPATPTRTDNTTMPRTPTGALPPASNQQTAVLQPGFGQMSPATGTFPTTIGTTGGQPTVLSQDRGQMSPTPKYTTGALTMPNSRQGEQNTAIAANAANTVKLTGPMKVVQMPVAGQPGKYITGLLPSLPQTPEYDEKPGGAKGKKAKPLHNALIVALALLVLLSSIGVFTYIHFRSGLSALTTPNSKHVPVAGTPNLKETAVAQLTATATANIIVSDTLSQNNHNWPTNPNEFFVNGAYHILDNASNGVAVVLEEKPFNISMVYSLTMEEIKGNDGTSSNSFGLIFRFVSATKNGKSVVTFYSFEVSNTNGGKYEFWKYDSSKSTPWQSIWQTPFGHEFHEGHGPTKINTLSVFENGKTFVFSVNGKKVGTSQDSSLPIGTVGMLVNLKGTEVAFTNMLITHN